MKPTHSTETAFNYQINGRSYQCPFEVTASILVSKWKMKIVKTLYDQGTLRYGQLKQHIRGEITHKMLTQSLQELEGDGIIVRTMLPVIPPHVEYALTEAGQRLSSVIESMNEFGTQYRVE